MMTFAFTSLGVCMLSATWFADQYAVYGDKQWYRIVSAVCVILGVLFFSGSALVEYGTI